MLRAQIFTHYRRFRAPDGLGGFPFTYGKKASIRVRLGLKQQTFRDQARLDVEIGRQTSARILYIGYTHPAFGVGRGDRLEDSDGVEFDVISVRTITSRQDELQMTVRQRSVA